MEPNIISFHFIASLFINPNIAIGTSSQQHPVHYIRVCVVNNAEIPTELDSRQQGNFSPHWRAATYLALETY